MHPHLGIMWVTITIKEHENVFLACCYLPHQYSNRHLTSNYKVVDHFNCLNSDIEAFISSGTIIICGDFNDTPMSYTYNIFNGLYLDAFRNSSSGLGVTYAGKVPAGRIDYIFHAKNLHSGNFEIQQNVNSDHRAITCKIWK